MKYKVINIKVAPPTEIMFTHEQDRLRKRIKRLQTLETISFYTGFAALAIIYIIAVAIYFAFGQNTFIEEEVKHLPASIRGVRHLMEGNALLFIVALLFTRTCYNDSDVRFLKSQIIDWLKVKIATQKGGLPYNDITNLYRNITRLTPKIVQPRAVK